MHTVETGAGRRYKVRWREGGRNRSRSFDRKRDADAFDSEVRRRRQAGTLAVLGGSKTVREYTGEWWTTYAERHLAPRTLDVYAVQLDLRILPALGGYRLRDLSPLVVREWIARMRKERVGNPSIVKACTVLQSMLGQAVVDGLTDRNPVALVRKPPQRRTREPDVIPPATVEKIRGSLELRDATLVSLLAYAGLRPESEAITLTWRQVGKRTLHIRASKTGRERQVPLLPPLADDLAEWRRATTARGLVFPHGGPWTRDDWRNWVRRIYRPAAVAAGLPASTRPRDLRGSFASLLIHSGMNVVEVAQRLGHSPQTCLTVYAAVFADFTSEDRVSAEDAILAARGAK